MNKIFTLFVALIATITLWAGNTITYTATEKLSETDSGWNWNSGIHTDAFNVSITSHTFADGTGTITFNGEVTSIGNSAFQGCSSLTSITIPNSVTSIEDYAFNYCSGLTSITIPNSVTSIGDNAFYHCSGLTSITIPNSVTSIGESAFLGCSSLTSITIGNSVTSIGESAFAGCYGLTSVTIPNSVTSIGEAAFLNCSGLTSITIPNSVTSIGDYAFYGCSGLTSITIPNSVTSIGGSAFSWCSGLTSITIPNSVTSIGSSAFYNCSSLTSIVVESGNTNYDSRENCNAIIETSTNTLISGCQNTIIPNSVTSIGYSAFSWCSGLTSITIPNSVTSIGDYAFTGCSGLTSITIPNSVTSIGYSAFSWCSGLTSIVVESGNTNYDSRENCNAIIETSTNTLISGCQNTIIPNSVTSIGDDAFSGCFGLTSITIPNSVTSIGYEAFDGCSGLTSITIGNSVTSIEDEAFHYCYKLKTVYNLSDLNIVAGAETYGYVAYYADNVYVSVTLSASSSDEQKGSVVATLGSVTLPNDTTLWSETVITLTATPATGFQFNGWSDGNTDNPRTITLTQDTNLVATFGTKMCTLTIISNIEEAADITGAGIYEYGTAVSCAVDVMTDYTFVKWGNGKTANPYKFKIYDDMTLYAFFEEDGGEPIAPNEMIVTPADDNATLQWPQVDNATSYTMTITKDGETICSLTFNGLGQLINIDFSAAPARAAAKITSATTGFNFTVTGLESATTYRYLIEAKDEKGKVLSTEEGTFTTTGEGTAIEETTVNKYVNTVTKVIRDGQLLILRDGKTYNMQGAVVE